MAIVTISRGSYSKGREIAERLAAKVGYECISRDILLEASEEFNVPEIKLIRAIHDAPSILDRLNHQKENYISFLRLSLLRRFCRDNVVYHGLAGHFFVQGIRHVLKIRVIADMEDRVKLEMERENISRKEALRILKKDDQERVKWGRHLYGLDTRDPRLYDMVIHIGKITTDEAVDIIRNALDSFKTTSESQRAMADLLLAAEVQAVLVDQKIRLPLSVSSNDGMVTIGPAGRTKDIGGLREVEKIVRGVPGVKDVVINVPVKSDYTNPWHKI
jgi:cytidylate kinase